MPTFYGKRLLIACGGTGGHLFPGIAVAEEWTRQGGEAMLLISQKQIDSLAAQGYDHLRFEKMAAAAAPRLLSAQMPKFLVSLLGGWFRSRRLLKQFKADAVLGMGGFTSTAPLLAGWSAGIPTFIHESNSIPGRANRLNARFSKVVLVGWMCCARKFPKHKVEIVGTPIRPSLEKKPTRAEAIRHFGLRADQRTVLMMGGSQGARRLNEMMAHGLPAFNGSWTQVLHISGPEDAPALRPFYEKYPTAGVFLDFCSEMQYAYAAADLVVCRSGASTMTELTHYGTPAIFVPYPFAADDHQTSNAEVFTEAGAAVMWKQEDLNAGVFVPRILQLLDDEARMRKMRQAMTELATPGAAARVCQVIAQNLP